MHIAKAASLLRCLNDLMEITRQKFEDEVQHVLFQHQLSKMNQVGVLSE